MKSKIGDIVLYNEFNYKDIRCEILKVDVDRYLIIKLDKPITGKSCFWSSYIYLILDIQAMRNKYIDQIIFEHK